jgi:dihydroflavonol-4-reductase
MQPQLLANAGRYLVTGATGLVGNNVVRRLLQLGAEVRVLVRSSASLELAGLPVELVLGDIRDPAAVRSAVRGVDAVIHAAGHVHIGWTQRDLHEQINIGGARNVALACRDAGARMVLVSTVNTLGTGPLAAPADEAGGGPGLPACPYIETKRQAENLVLELAASGLYAVVTHPTFMLGPWDWKPSSGRMLLAVARGVDLTPIGAFSLCDARDVADALISAAALGISGSRYVLAGHNLTYRDAFRQFAERNAARAPWFPIGPIMRFVGGRGGDLWARLTGREWASNSAAVEIVSQESCFSSARAVAELGYQIRPLAEIIDDAWDWFQAHGYIEARAGRSLSVPPCPAEARGGERSQPAAPHFSPASSGDDAHHEERAGHRR